MDKKLKAKWIKALRSGNFKQLKGRYYDRESNRYCCIGVLGRIAQGDSYTGSGHATLETKLGEHCQELIDMNDSGKSFKRIAAYIEAKL